MKQIFLSLLLFVATAELIKAQNLQLHYDFGKDRQMFTTTVEMFKPDNLGNTFFFIDMDYGGKSADVDGVSLAYCEIARVFKTEKCPLVFMLSLMPDLAVLIHLVAIWPTV